MKSNPLNKSFSKSKRKHIVMITNHGCHGPVISPTTDTGGQNFYVNALSRILVEIGYKVTILNRGGYKHPVTKKWQKGIVYFDSAWGTYGIYCRVIYLEDSKKEFIVKEKLNKEGLREECDFLINMAKKIGWELRDTYLLSSHYWDAGIFGIMLNDYIFSRYKVRKPHVWTTHSLAKFKMERLIASGIEITDEFAFPKRIEMEEEIFSKVDGVVATSNLMRKFLGLYNVKAKNQFWLPPGINPKMFKSRPLDDCVQAIAILEDVLDKSTGQVKRIIQKNVVFVEFSRTATVKRKDLVIESFSKLPKGSNAILVMNVDTDTNIYNEIMKIYKGMENKEKVVLIRKYLSQQEMTHFCSLADVFVTTSLSDPWGMSCEEAAASRCAIISSEHVAFANEVLGDKNSLIVKDDCADSYAEMMQKMLDEPNERKRLANQAYNLVAHDYTWKSLAINFIKNMKKSDVLK